MPTQSSKPVIRRPRTSRVSFQEPLMSADLPQPAPATAKPEPVARPTEHNGIRILREEPQMALPKAPFRFTKIYLEDGTTAMACRDCSATADNRAQILLHRNEAHGARNFKRRRVDDLQPLRIAPDPVLPQRPDGSPAPSAPLDMTLREFLAICPDLAAMGDLIDRLEAERDSAKDQLREHEKVSKEQAHRLAVYPALQDEVVDLRMLVKDAGRYEDMKAELLELRAWKKRMITKLSPLGFNFTEEEQ